MKKFLLLAALVCGFTTSALADAVIGKPAPGFLAADTRGVSFDLAALKGKTVVLEWTNYGCPFTRKHYDSGNMQALQKEITDKGVVWISVMSSAEGKEGYYATDALAQKAADARKVVSTHIVRDAKGTLGRLYGASTTPNLFVIDKTGTLIYKGAIDDAPSADPATIKGARNYVREAVAATLAGKKIAEPETRPYGCAVKY